MGKVTFRLPSETVKYGYIEYTFDFDARNPIHLGEEYRVWVEGFQKGESPKVDTNGAPYVSTEASDVMYQKNKETLEGLLRDCDKTPASVSEVSTLTHEEAQDLIVTELGASVYDEPVEAETPDWEEPPAPPAEDDWDF